MRPWIAAVTLVPLVSRVVTSQTPTDSALTGITARGRLLAQHDAASWQATDALQALTKDLSGLNVSVALRDSVGRWIVRFGRVTTPPDTFFVMFTAEPAANGRRYEARRHSPPVIGGDRERIIATATLTALKDFGAPTRAHNSYGLPADDGGVWVYFVPAQTRSRIYPHGGDIRYHLAANGQRILDQHRFHRAILEFPAPADSVVAGIHTSFDSLPADTDVLYVLLRRPQKPEIIVTEKFLFQIAPDGSITWRAKEP